MGLVDKLPPAFAGVMTRYRGATDPVPKKKPGRPLKRTLEYLSGLLQDHQIVAAWYQQEFGCEASSDRALYEAYFSRTFTSNGERAGRVAAPEFQRALKTLRNELAEARRLARLNPQNAPISGTPTSVQCSCARTFGDVQGDAAWK